MSKDFQVTIHGPRGDEWERVLGTRTFAVQSPFPHWCSLPGHSRAQVYLLDLDQLAPDARRRLVGLLAAKFDLSPAQAAAEVERVGVPILAEDCSVTILHPQRWI